MCAVCAGDNGGSLSASKDWIFGRTCPRGWGRCKHIHPDSYSVQNSQGYVRDGRVPVYGYVTRYRTAYYNYITARVSKA